MEKLDLSEAERLTRLPIEEVVWEDHFSTDSWLAHDAEEVLDTILVTSVGYRLKETRAKIVLIQHRTTNAQIGGTITILKKTVKSRTIIREAQ